MSKLFSNPESSKRILEPLFKKDRIKFRSPRNSQQENVETNLIKLDLTRISEQLNDIDDSVLTDITYFIGDIEDIDTSDLLDDGLSYQLTELKSYAGSAPSVLKNAVIWLDVDNSVMNEQTMSNYGIGGSTLDAKYGSVAASAGARIIDGALEIPTGGAGDYAVCFDHAGLDITGSMEIEWIGDLDWSIPALSNDLLVGKETPTQRSYLLRRLSGSNSIIFAYSATNNTTPGTDLNTIGTSSPVPAGSNGVKVVFNANNGAGSKVCTYYYTNDYGITWNLLSNHISAGTVPALFTGTADLQIGWTTSSGAALRNSKTKRVRIKNGINGPVVFDARFDLQEDYTFSFKESSSFGAVVNIISTANDDVNNPTFIPHEGENYLYLPGNTGNYAIVPYSKELITSGDLEIVLRFSFDELASGVGNKYPFGRRNTTGDQRCWLLEVTYLGKLALYLSTAGTSASEVVKSSTANLNMIRGVPYWVKATVDIDNGNNGYDVKFWYAEDQEDEPTTWIQLGNTVTTSTPISLFKSNAPLVIGGWADGGTNTKGRYYRAILRDGIGGPTIVDVDFTKSITDGGQNTVSFTGTANNSKDAAQYLKNLGTGGSVLDAKKGSAGTIESSDPVTLLHTGTNYMYLPGLVSNYASTPSNAPLDLTDDCQFVFRVSTPTWSAAQLLLAKPYSTGGYYVSLNTTTIEFVYSLAVTPTVLSSASVTWDRSAIAANTVLWIRLTRVSSTGVVTLDYAADQPSEPTTWTTVGNSGARPSGAIATNTNALGIGGNSSSVNWTGAIYRTIVRHNGTTVFDADFTTGITSGAQTTFTESSANAATVTINRSAAGPKAVAVTRSCLLFGTNDYLEIPHHPLLNVVANEDFTLFFAGRTWDSGSTFRSYIGKRANTTPSGYEISYSNTGNNIRFAVGVSPSPIEAPVTQTWTVGQLACVTGIRDSSGIRLYKNTTATTNTTTAGFYGTATSISAPFRVGARYATPSEYGDFEFFGAAFFARALTAAEVTLLNNHYNGTITTDSTNLLKSAVLWLDSEESLENKAILIRSSSGLKATAVTKNVMLFGANDYLEVPDHELLDIGASESFTVMALVRQWDTPVSAGRYVSKGNGGTASSLILAGYSNYARVRIDGVSGFSSADTPDVHSGGLAIFSASRNTGSDNLVAYLNNVAGTSVSDTTTGTLANAIGFRVGADGAAQYQDFEFFALAFWRRALTADEIQEINDYYYSYPVIFSIDTLPKLSGKLSRLFNKIQRLESGN